MFYFLRGTYKEGGSVAFQFDSKGAVMCYKFSPKSPVHGLFHWTIMANSWQDLTFYPYTPPSPTTTTLFWPNPQSTLLYLYTHIIIILLFPFHFLQLLEWGMRSVCVCVCVCVCVHGQAPGWLWGGHFEKKLLTFNHVALITLNIYN